MVKNYPYWLDRNGNHDSGNLGVYHLVYSNVGDAVMRHWRVTLITTDGILHRNDFEFDLPSGAFIGVENDWFRIGNIYSIQADHVISWNARQIKKAQHGGNRAG